MRYGQGMIPTAAAVVLSLMTVTGVAFSNEFPQAAYASSIGLDALVVEMFEVGSTVHATDAAVTESVRQ